MATMCPCGKIALGDTYLQIYETMREENHYNIHAEEDGTVSLGPAETESKEYTGDCDLYCGQCGEEIHGSLRHTLLSLL